MITGRAPEGRAQFTKGHYANYRTSGGDAHARKTAHVTRLSFAREERERGALHYSSDGVLKFQYFSERVKDFLELGEVYIFLQLHFAVG